MEASLKLALVHDYLNQMGGAERAVEALLETFPEAPLYTSIYLSQNMPQIYQGKDIRTSFMQRLPFLNRHFKKYLLLYPYAFESFNLNEYEVVLSSSSAWAKGVRISPETCHICYCYTPMRWVWNYDEYVRRENFGWLIRKALPLAIRRLEKWDRKTIDRVDHYIAISKNVAKRIKKLYHREATVIYPPVRTDNFFISPEVEDYYLIVSRLNSYKRIDLAIEVFNALKKPLKIIGDGPHRPVLEKMAKGNVEFLGRLPDEKIAQYYAKCQALIFPGEEDFGIAPVEAQASGRPVIAYGRGGALEVVIDGQTGLFFYEQTFESLKKVIKNFERLSFDPQLIRKKAQRFDKAIFMRKIKDFVEEKYQIFQQARRL